MALLKDDEVKNLLGENGLSNWNLINKELQKEYVFEDFKEAMLFVNKLADLAENLQHHPDIKIVWNKVTLNISTHDEGGVTKKDIDLVKKIAEL